MGRVSVGCAEVAHGAFVTAKLLPGSGHKGPADQKARSSAWPPPQHSDAGAGQDGRRAGAGSTKDNLPGRSLTFVDGVKVDGVKGEGSTEYRERRLNRDTGGGIVTSRGQTTAAKACRATRRVEARCHSRTYGRTAKNRDGNHGT